MSENLENTESAAENERRKASTEPGLAGGGGQYVEGDYGDAGTVGAGSTEGTEVEEPVEGEYPEGDYGDAGTVGTAREAETDEERNS